MDIYAIRPSWMMCMDTWNQRDEEACGMFFACFIKLRKPSVLPSAPTFRIQRKKVFGMRHPPFSNRVESQIGCAFGFTD